MFYLRYIVSELRRRKRRTFLTVLGLGVGVGLVVTVAALSSGLDKAQDEVLEPLTGVGTDLSVSRPIQVDENSDEGQVGPSARLASLAKDDRSPSVATLCSGSQAREEVINDLIGKAGIQWRRSQQPAVE